MLLPRLFAPVRASSQACSSRILPSSRVFDALRATNGSTAYSPTFSFIRHASHQTQGRANGAKDGPGKRLGAKKSGGEYVIPGNIIFRQRGTTWYPGENCKFGRDHCVFAMESGYVRYYRDPRKHPDRQYIGVALEKDDTLPYPPNAIRRRRLNMVPVRIDVESKDLDGQTVVPDLQVVGDAGSDINIADTPRNATSTRLVRGKGYAFREANWEIGRAAERANVHVKQFIPGDRWTAWRKAKAKHLVIQEKKKLRNASKKVGKAKKR